MAVSAESVDIINRVATIYTRPGQTAATVQDTARAVNSDPATQTQNTINAGLSAAQLATAIEQKGVKSIY